MFPFELLMTTPIEFIIIHFNNRWAVVVDATAGLAFLAGSFWTISNGIEGL